MSSRSRWELLIVLILVVLALGVAGSYYALRRNAGSQTMTITPYVTTVTGTGVTATFSVTTAASVATTGSATSSVSNRSLAPHIASGNIFLSHNENGEQEENEPPMADVAGSFDGTNRIFVQQRESESRPVYRSSDYSCGFGKLRAIAHGFISLILLVEYRHT
jgi:hypothetical protein